MQLIARTLSRIKKLRWRPLLGTLNLTASCHRLSLSVLVYLQVLLAKCCIVPLRLETCRGRDGVMCSSSIGTAQSSEGGQLLCDTLLWTWLPGRVASPGECFCNHCLTGRDKAALSYQVERCGLAVTARSLPCHTLAWVSQEGLFALPLLVVTSAGFTRTSSLSGFQSSLLFQAWIVEGL